jgi:NitT/TauT family transport system substrate-binding protein
LKKTLVLAIILAMIASLTVGCQTKKEEATKEKLDYTLKFGTLPAESAIPIIIAKEQGFFEKEGVSVEVMPFFAPNDRNIAVQAGKVDATIGDIMTSLTFHEAGTNMKITSDINEDFKLLTSPNSGIDSFEKLDGKDVSIVPNFVLEYIMDKMAEKNNIEYKVVSIPQFTARFEALLADKIDGVVFTEPQATLLASKGAHVLASSEEYGIKAGTLLFNEKTLNNNPEEVKAFYRAYNNAVEYINTADPSEYSKVLKQYGFPEGIDKYLGGDVEYSKAEEITNEGFNDVLKWTKSKGLVKKDYKLEDVSNFSFIK